MKIPLPEPQQLQFPSNVPPCYSSLWSQPFVQPNPNFNNQVAHQFKTCIFPTRSPIKCNVISFREGRGVNLETPPITTQHLPREETLIHKPLERQSMIGTCSKTVVEAHKEENPRVSLNHPFQSEERKLQALEGLYKLENHEYVCPIESWFQTIVSTTHSLIIQNSWYHIK